MYVRVYANAVPQVPYTVEVNAVVCAAPVSVFTGTQSTTPSKIPLYMQYHMIRLSIVCTL